MASPHVEGRAEPEMSGLKCVVPEGGRVACACFMYDGLRWGRCGANLEGWRERYRNWQRKLQALASAVLLLPEPAA